jgi:hypothetical protein
MARGDDRQQQGMFSYLSPEERVPPDHPVRAIRTMVDVALRDLSSTFDALYAKAGRPSIPPEQLLRALLLQVLYTVRSERLLMRSCSTTCCFGGLTRPITRRPIRSPGCTARGTAARRNCATWPRGDGEPQRARGAS